MIKSPVLPVNDTAVGANDDDTQTPEAAVLLPLPPPPGVARWDLPTGTCPMGRPGLRCRRRGPASTFKRLSS